MNHYRLFDCYRQLANQNILLFFSGVFSDKILVGIRDAIIRKLSGNTEQRIIKKVCSVFIEFAQNIYIHSAENRNGIIFIEDEKDVFRIYSGNLIEISRFNSLIAKISHINQLDKDELKSFYRKKLRDPGKKGNVGGGLGLIVIARKSGHPIETTFHLVSNHMGFIELSVKINKEEIK